LVRLVLIVPKFLTSFDKFLEVNEIDNLSVNRDKLLADILSEKQVELIRLINMVLYVVQMKIL